MDKRVRSFSLSKHQRSTHLSFLEPIASETEISSCYLIDLCALCGKNPPRGVCLPERNLSRCECFVNTEDLSRPYVGDFCLPEKLETTNFSSTSSNWSIIVIAILTSCVILIGSILGFLLVMAYRRRQQRLPTENPSVHLNSLISKVFLSFSEPNRMKFVHRLFTNR